MQTLQHSADAEDQTQLVPLQVIILYENLDSGRQARRTYNYLVASLKGACEFRVRCWKFNLLENPRLRALTAQDAAEADIIIVASEGNVELPDAVQSWFELWLGSKVHAIGLVGLFQHPENAAVVRDYLAEVARKAAVEFFAQPGAASRQFVLSPFTFAGLANN